MRTGYKVTKARRFRQGHPWVKGDGLSWASRNALSGARGVCLGWAAGLQVGFEMVAPWLLGLLRSCWDAIGGRGRGKGRGGSRGCLNTAEIDFSQSGGWKVQYQGLEGSVPGDGLLSGSRTTVFSLCPDMV